MATTLVTPQVLAEPFANGGDYATIPNTKPSAGVASIEEGIPVECSQTIGSGGSYLRRIDINGLGYLATYLMFFLQNGGSYTFDSDVSTAIGGYPYGAKLWATIDAESVLVRSLKNNNTDDFVATPAYIGNGTSWAIDVPSNLAVKQYMHLQEQQATTVAGGTFTKDLWTLRNLNTELTDVGAIPGATLVAGQISLPAGTYRVSAKACGYRVALHRLKLANLTDGTDTLLGLCEMSDYGSYDGTVTLLTGQFTITTPKLFELQHRCSYTFSTLGRGYPSSFGEVEVYASLEIWKLY